MAHTPRTEADFNVGPDNIHHRFTGLVLIAVGGPLALFRGSSRRRIGLGPVAGRMRAYDKGMYGAFKTGSS